MMTKVFGLNNSVLKNKKRISVRMPKEMLNEIDTTLSALKISTRLRSRWISEAIVNFYKNNDYIEAVQEEWIDPGQNKVIQIFLEKEAEDIVELIVSKLKNTEEAHAEPSSIIRASVIHELLRNEFKQNK